MHQSRVTTWPLCDMRRASRSNSLRESSTGTSETVTSRRPASRRTGPTAEDLLVVLGDGNPASQHGPHAGDELAQAERLGHVVAGAQFEPEHNVDLGVACGDHDDGHGLQAAHLLADLDTGLVRQHHVEQDEIGVDAVEETQRLMPVAGRLDGEALSGQARSQCLTVGLLVVDHEDQWSIVPGRAG